MTPWADGAIITDDDVVANCATEIDRDMFSDSDLGRDNTPGCDDRPLPDLNIVRSER